MRYSIIDALYLGVSGSGLLAWILRA